MPPPQPLAGFARVGEQVVHLSGAVIQRVNVHVVVPVEIGIFERGLHQLLHGVTLARSQHIVVRLILLQYHPHALNVVGSVAPIAPRLQVAQVQLVFYSALDSRHSASYFSRDERLSAARGLVVEQDTAASKQLVALAIVNRDLVRESLRAGVRTAWPEGSGFVLRRRRRTEHFARRCLIEPRFQTDVADRLEHAEGTVSRDVTGVLRHIETHAHVTLRGEIVNLVGLYFVKQAPKAGRIREIAQMEKKATVLLMPV